MKVTIEDGCISCGACESVCDAVFSIEDIAVVNEAAVAANQDCVKEAADACPVSVIKIEEQKLHRSMAQDGLLHRSLNSLKIQKGGSTNL